MPRRLAPRLALAALALARVAAAEDAAAPVAADGRKVAIEYTLTLEDGKAVSSNAGGKPFVYEQGSGALVPGLEAAVAGMAAGEAKRGVLVPEAAFGAVEKDFFAEVDASRIPEAERRVGAQLEYRDEDGQPILVRVHELRGDKVVIDFNHPLAGHPIRYEVKVLSVE
jgi:FKBP-type peptidyl-prolyl cis-trans isomerase 2